MNRKQLFAAKARATAIIVDSNVKSVSEKDFTNTAKATGLKAAQVKKAWMQFTESGGTYIDGRVSTKEYIGKEQFCNPSVKGQYGRREVSPDEAAEILLYYMSTHYTTSRDVANKYKVSVQQIYEWIHELNVSGTLLGQMILNPRKYAKPEVKDVIWLTKHPKTTRKTVRNLSSTEKMNYVRVSQVLRKYLTALAELDVEVFLKTAVMEDEELRSKRYPKKKTEAQ